MPGSSSTINTVGAAPIPEAIGLMLVAFIFTRHLDNGEEQAEAADRLDEAVVLDRLGNVAVATEFVAAADFARIVRRGQYDDRNLVGGRIGLEAAQHFHAVDP